MRDRINRLLPPARPKEEAPPAPPAPPAPARDTPPDRPFRRDTAAALHRFGELKARLDARFREPGARGTAVSASAPPPRPPGSSARRPALPGGCARLLGGYYPEGLEGRLVVREDAYPLAERRGGRPLGDWLEAADLTIPLFRDSAFPPDASFSRALLFDLETTGLAGGAGTFAFLLGAARVEGDALVVRQYFLEDPSAEAAMLERAMPLFTAAAMLASFNGKAYDAPLLENRLVLSRLTASPLRRPHLDLLHAARTFFKGITPGCSLRALETSLFGLERDDDIPGALIPEAYFAFQRRGEVAALPRILAHNRDDLVHMLLVAGAAGRALADRDHGGVATHRVGKRIMSRVSRADGESWLEEAAGEGADIETRWRAMEALAASRKACGRDEEAARLWREMADLAPDLAAKPLVELAKYHEHRRKDPAAALACLDEALRLPECADDPALAHRRARLLRKLGREGE